MIRSLRSRACGPWRALPTLAVLLALTTAATPGHSVAGPVGVTVPVRQTGVADRVGVLVSTRPDADHFCTASVVHSSGHDLLVTAAHCLGDGSGLAHLTFVPGYRDGRAPFGAWRLERAYLTPSWTLSEDPDADLAFVQVEARDGRDIEDLVGGFRVSADPPDGFQATVIGYPRVLETPISCTNDTERVSSTQRKIDCPGYSSGTSGSPWLTSSGTLTGVLGGLEEGGSTAEVSYSAVLDEEGRQLYETASGS
ncbi:trypsin-like serine peptidase [Streptomyces sp. NPDC006879]|uniref:trypsin-like serine peptidase n=1 Tax=Streptomyces sp. NPDC006879 TaxID=3364767 RepID=UPI0036839087